MPRRWTDLDSDESRLPEGFRRVGYDADERRHYFHDAEGQAWQSEPGNEYGVLTPVRPEPPVTIPRRPPPPYSKEPVDDPPPEGSTLTSKNFKEMLSRNQITSAPSTPKRAHTIHASLKRSSTAAASFIRSRGKNLTKLGNPKEQSHDNDYQQSLNPNHDRRAVSSPVTIRRSSTTTTASSRSEAKPDVRSMGDDPSPPQEVGADPLLPQEVGGDGLREHDDE